MMDIKDWIGPAISGIGALVSLVFSVITRFEVKRQQRLQLFSLRRQYDTDLRAWANLTLESLTEAITLTFVAVEKIEPKEFNLRLERVLARLSTLTDSGRWFFPNEGGESYGQWKPAAFRGFRPAILNCIIGAFMESKKLATGTNNEQNISAIRSDLVEHRKQFVTFVQSRLDPLARDNELNKLLE